MPNMTGVTEANNVLDMMNGLDTAIASTLGFNILGVLLLLLVFIIVLFRMSASNPPAESFSGASLVSVVLSMFLTFLGLLPWQWILICGSMWGLSAIALYKSNSF